MVREHSVSQRVGVDPVLVLLKQRMVSANFSRKHPSRDVIFAGQILQTKKKPNIITSHGALEPSKQITFGIA